MRHISEDSLAAFIRENQSGLYRMAYSYVKNRDDALDVVQDSIIKAYEKRKTLRDPERIKAWFYKILVNRSMDYIRQSGKLVYMDQLPEARSDVQEESQVINSVTIGEAMNSLPEGLKTIVFLRFFEDMKLEEIADVTDAPLSTVKTRLYRALSLLRMELSTDEGGKVNDR